MSPERRTSEGIFWSNPNLGIDEESVYGLGYHFVPDGEEERVQEEWGKNNPLHQRKGWRVGQSDAPLGCPIYTYQLVVFDGDESVTGIHESKLKRI